VLAAVAGLLLGLGATTGLGIAFGSGRFAGESQESKALLILRADVADLNRLTRAVTAAPHLAQLTSAGAAAQQAVDGPLRGRDARLALLDDPKVAGTATRTHQAIVAIASAYAKLTDVDARHLDAWDIPQAHLTNALGTVDSTAVAVQALDREALLRIDTRPAQMAAEHVAGYLTASARKLERYERRLAAYRRKHRAEIKVAADYRATVQMQMGAYGATRRELQQYINDVKDSDERIDAYRSALQDARRRREGIRATLASLTAPVAVASAHQRLIGVLDRAISATDVGVDLADAIQAIRYEGDPYTSAFDLPEYQRFQELSNQIGGEYNSAMGAWNARIDNYLDHLKGAKGGPHKPVI
jgi:hypothetical protein